MERLRRLPSSLHGIGLGIMGLSGLWHNSSRILELEWLSRHASNMAYFAVVVLAMGACRYLVFPCKLWKDAFAYKPLVTLAAGNMGTVFVLCSLLSPKSTASRAVVAVMAFFQHLIALLFLLRAVRDRKLPEPCWNPPVYCTIDTHELAFSGLLFSCISRRSLHAFQL